jgi:hypothetical protein
MSLRLFRARFRKGSSLRFAPGQVERVTLHFLDDVFPSEPALSAASAFSTDSPSCSRTCQIHHPQISTTSDVFKLTPFVPRSVELIEISAPGMGAMLEAFGCCTRCATQSSEKNVSRKRKGRPETAPSGCDLHKIETQLSGRLTAWATCWCSAL